MTGNRLVEMDAFVRVVKNQNFTAAASELGVSPALVTRRVQKLEADLGVRLISRSTRRLSLTEAGKRHYEFCARILKELQEEENAIKQLQSEPAGTLNVVAPMSFGILEMGKAVTSFMLQYPKIQVTLIIGDNGRRSFDPSEYGADVVIRFTQPKDSSLHFRKIGRMSWTPARLARICAKPARRAPRRT
jgi:DNA-binding transcriptional LysR family regulator